MGDASYVQTSFLGGEISQWSQGKFDDPKVKTALARCLNAYPVDEGACPRRPGSQLLGTTRNGAPGRLIPFDFTEDAPYNLEFTDGFMRMWNGTQLVTTNDNQTVTSISGASPAVFTLPATVEWGTGEECIFAFKLPADAVTGAVLLNRQFVMTMLSPTTFNVADAITGALINGTGLTSLTPIVGHVAQIITPYTEAGKDWHDIRSVQGYNLSMFLHNGVVPQFLQVIQPPTPTSFAAFKYGPAVFQDGPYLDAPANAIATPSAISGVIQLTIGFAPWAFTNVYGFGVPVTYNAQDYVSLINNNIENQPDLNPLDWLPLPPGLSAGPAGFTTTDVGRMMRLFSAPQVWLPATTYPAGASVTYNGEYFTSLVDSNQNNEPDISLTDWVINTSAAIWTWGVITFVNSANSVSLQMFGANLLYTTPIPKWRLGAWSDTTGWPTCGCYFEGRFWFMGAIPNRLDSSQPNLPFNMAPTEQDGTVDDSNAISYTLNADSQNPGFWMIPDIQGIIIGTQEGEWHLTTGTAGTPMTPSSIQAHRVTKYGTSNIQPVRTGLTICFVQRYARRLFEYLADTFSQRFYAPDLTLMARHLGKRVFQELAYQQELVPIVWARMADKSLIGTTYRRVSLFSTQPPEFNGFHQHTLGSNRQFESICVGPSNDGSLDALAMVTNDPATNIRFVESMTSLLDEDDPLYLAWFLDTAITPPAAQFSGNNVTFYGLHRFNGRSVSVFAAAMDCGDYVVENGQVTVPFGVTDTISGQSFGLQQMQLLQQYVSEFSMMAVTITGGAKNLTIPCVIGFNYITQVQLCRPLMPADTGAKNGPGFGKRKRTARYAIYLVNSLGVKVGTDFNDTKPVLMTTPGGKPFSYLATDTGIRRETLKNDFSFDSMLCWQTTRPYPATVATYGGFIETEDV